MIIEQLVPAKSPTMTEGTIVLWRVKPGDKVKSGDIIGTIQTDKATLEMEAPGSGILTGFLIDAGETVPVGAPIAEIGGSGASVGSVVGTRPLRPAQPMRNRARLAVH